MCRSIVSLRHPDGLAGADEIEAAALQFVRKISGYRKPSQRNEAAFNAAVAEIAATSSRMLAALAPSSAGPTAVTRAPGSHAHHEPASHHESAGPAAHLRTRVTTIRSTGRASRS